MATLAIDDILEEPRFFPHRLDAASRRIMFVETERETIAGSAFLDGRTPLGRNDRSHVIPIDAALARPPRAQAPARAIFHGAFCGSTLLSRALDRPGTSLSLREPQVLVDLANWRLELGGADLEGYRATRDLVMRQLGKRWTPDEAILLKPSNWVNIALGDLAGGAGFRALFQHSGLESFLIAVFRGGRDRMDFICRFLIQMVRSRPDTQPLLAEATGVADPLGAVARLTVLAWALQQQAFDAAAARLGPGKAAQLDLETLNMAPAGALASAARALDLALTPDDIDAIVADRFASHAKDPARAYDHARRAEEDAAVRRLHAVALDGALAWAREKGLDG